MIKKNLERLLALFFMISLAIMSIGFVSAVDFSAGDTLEVFNTGSYGLVVRGPNACDGQINGKFDGDKGIVLEGPVFCNGYNRWRVRWEDGVEGWSAEDWLKRADIATKSIIITSPLKITPEKNEYFVGDIINAEFAIKNEKTVPVAFNVITVGGRFNGSKLSNGGYPDFTFKEGIILNPGDSYVYKGELVLTEEGNYHFFSTYKDDNGNWNPSIDLGEGLTDKDRVRDINIVAVPEGPYIESISPSEGAPGINVTINGRNFKNIGSVFFGGNSASIVGWSDDKLIVVVPYGSGNVDVVVGTFLKSNPVTFTYKKPIIEIIEPAFGGPNKEVKIKGKYFGTRGRGINYDFNVMFGASEADIVSWKDNEIIVKAPLDFGAGIDDAVERFKFSLKIARMVIGIGWFKVAGYLIDLGIPDVVLSPSEDGILEAVYIQTPVGYSNAVRFTWKTPAEIIEAKLNSPAELQVYDSQGRVIGLVNGIIKKEIPDSVYDAESKSVIIINPSDNYNYKVVGIEKGLYGLNINSVKNGDVREFVAKDIPIINQEVHKYSINWDVISRGEKGANLEIDFNGDDIFERTIESENNLTLNGVLVTKIKDTGWKSPSATGKIYHEWTNPKNGFYSDDRYVISEGKFSNQDYYNFDFNIPEDAVIKGVEVMVEGHGIIGGADIAIVEINALNNPGEGVKNNGAGGWWVLGDGSDKNVVGGNSTDLWGRSWKALDFSNENFLLKIKTWSNPDRIYIDDIKAKVYYEIEYLTSEDSMNDSKVLTLISDNFESYADGSLSGQGRWFGSDEIVVQREVVKEGSKAISWSVNNGDDPIVNALGSSISDGKQTFYTRVSNTNYNYFTFKLLDESNRVIVNMRWAGTNLQYQNSDDSFTTIKYNMNADEWYAIQVEWNSNDKVRYGVNEVWTEWVSRYKSGGIPKSIRINPYGAGGSWKGHIDFLSGDLIGS